MRKSSRGIVFVEVPVFVVLIFLTVALPRTARAQDSFEIRVEQFETPAFGGLSLEEHLNFVEIGTSRFYGTVAPTNHQFHMSTELTGGLTSQMSVGVMLMTAAVPGPRGGFEYAGWRVLPHFYAPLSWRLPVRLGLTAEFSFQRTAFDESPATLEFRPVVEKTFGRVQFDLNPSFERSISHSNVPGHWDFQPAVRIAYEMNPRFTPSLEYYGAYGSLMELRPPAERVHRIFPGADIHAREKLLLNVGVGAGIGPAGDRLIYKTRVEFTFGRNARQ